MHCYNYWRADEENVAGTSLVSNEDVFISIAGKMVDLQPVSVTITGGEPLLVFPKVLSSIELLLQHNIHVAINTNAALTTSEIAEYLSKREIGAFVSFPCGNATICDAMTNTKGSFDQIVRGILTLKKFGVPITINTVVSRINLKYLYATAEFIKKSLKLSDMSITRVAKPINSSVKFDSCLLNLREIRDVLDLCLRINRELGLNISTANPYCACTFTSQDTFDFFAYKKLCTAGKTSYAITSSGDIKACPRDITTYGNILKNAFEESWLRMSDWRNNKWLPVECDACSVKNKCGGGCRLDAYPQTESLSSVDTSADIGAMPVKFSLNYQNNANISDNDIFIVNKNIRAVNESFGVRVSVKSKHVYISNDLFEYLKIKSHFSIIDLSDYFKIDKNIAHSIFNKLRGVAIITPKHPKGGSSDVACVCECDAVR
jgi:radical SAM protein with 4Fe4S-binding SPASM domain